MNDYQTRKKQLTTSHKLLYIILAVYVFVALYCSIVISILLETSPETVPSIMIPYLSYATICGTSTITCYCFKAQEENKLQIQLSKYRMKIEMAKQIYRDISTNNLDDKSIELIKSLSESDNAPTEIASSNSIQMPNQDGLG